MGYAHRMFASFRIASFINDPDHFLFSWHPLIGLIPGPVQNGTIRPWRIIDEVMHSLMP